MKLLLVGGGNMGSAMLADWHGRSGLEVDVVDPHPSETVKAKARHVFTALDDVNAVYDGVILAVKPQNFPEILPCLSRLLGPESWVLSIAAGKAIAGIADAVGENRAIIRAMPNTPALIGQGMSVCVASPATSDAQKQTVMELLSAIGDLAWVGDEEQMHAVTALSGSGPAYVFALIEAMVKAGRENGLSADLALQLALKTVQGAGALALQSPHSPTELRQQVTSPKGTTEAALAVLQGNDALDRLVGDAIRAAANRSRELA